MAQQIPAILFHSTLSRRDIAWRPKQIIRRQDAQSIIELALMVPFFIILLLGSAELAQVAWAAVLTSNAARAGAQYGAQNVATAGDAAGIRTNAANDGVNLTNLVTTPTTFCACSNGTSIPTGQCTNAISYCSAAAGTILNYVKVNTSSTVTPLVHYPGLPRTFTVIGQSIMVVEQ
jgi:Flp pilus assembly protein TadG